MFKKVPSKIFSPSMKNENKMYSSNIVIAPKPMNASQKMSKLKILPATIKPTFKTASSSKLNCKYYNEKLYLKYVIFY